MATLGVALHKLRAVAPFALFLWVFVASCGDPGAPSPCFGPGCGGSVGSGGDLGAGGAAGAGGELGSGGVSGTGGIAGTGGTGSSIGSGGSGGTGGISTGPCVTNALCHTCPDTFLCDTDDDCAFSGYVCVASGCETHGGAPIKQCQPSRGPSCDIDDDCPDPIAPNTVDYQCIAVAPGPKRCVRVTGGCQPATESFDCPPGFSCEGETCVDRRMPCDTYLDCPKSHVCVNAPNSSYCVRTHRTCADDTDCGGFAAVGSWCADVDGDGTKECVGELGSSGQACVNADCAASGPGPVCESGAAPSLTTCGEYGLCQDSTDCDTGFVCVGLWQDGRKECVLPPGPGSCDRVTQCPLHQVCAAPRSGGSPRCQAGKEAM
ncbi:MAG: hypothetical protein PVH21_14680 [Myxococcales bacterium]